MSTFTTSSIRLSIPWNGSTKAAFWTEAYLLRAFLAFNSVYDIVLFNTFLERFYRDEFVQDMPLCLKNEGGSIWLQRRPERE